MTSIRVAKSPGRPRTFDRDKALVKALEIFWRKGYEPASISELCAAMEINPPSLYAAFGNKARLFLEAVDYYEQTYWKATWEKMSAEEDVFMAIEQFFSEAANILLSPTAPCGCLIVLAAINISPESTDVADAVRVMRQEGKTYLERRLSRAVSDGQLTQDTDISALASVLKTLLEGMSIEARDGVSPEMMRGIGHHAVKLLKS